MIIRAEDVVGPNGQLLPEPLLRILNQNFDELARLRNVRWQWADLTLNSTTGLPVDIKLDLKDKPAAVLCTYAQVHGTGAPAALPTVGLADWLWIHKDDASYARVRNVPGLTASTTYDLTVLVLWRD